MPDEYPQRLPETDAASDLDYDELAARLQGRMNSDRIQRSGYGLLWLGASAALAAGIAMAHDSDDKITMELPYIPAAQDAVEAVDDVLAAAGMGLTVAGGLVIGGVKLGSRYSPTLRSIDRSSSQELTDDGRGEPSIFRRGLRNVAAGTVPVVAGVSVGIGGLMAAVGHELSEGPTRPIESLLGPLSDRENPDVSLVIQDASANPMTESNISRELAAAIYQEAVSRDVQAVPLDLHLGTIYQEDKTLTSLVVGTVQEDGSLLKHDASTEGCDDVPVAVDSAASIDVGNRIQISGIDARVVEEKTDTSAINRIGVEADPSVVATCFNQQEDEPHDLVALLTNESTATDILNEANQNLDKPATVVNEQDYISSSEDFWKANAKPLTNVTALTAGLGMFISMGGVMGARLMRNRREWATKLAQGVSDNQLRATELVRSLKDGMVASALGVSLATAISPAINFLESGLRVGMDFRSAMTASAIGIIGSVAGTATKVIRPRRIVDPTEHTRI